MIGKLNASKILVEYKGVETSTARTTVNNDNYTIEVDVKEQSLGISNTRKTVQVGTTGWNQVSNYFYKHITVLGITEQTDVSVSLNLPKDISASDKKVLNKQFSQINQVECALNRIIIYSSAIPTVPFNIDLRWGNAIWEN
jgi:hypothetical protein